MAEAIKTGPSSATHKSAPSQIVSAEIGRRKEEEMQASVLVTDEGATIIHNEVVAKIAGMAVREVDGVHELVPFDAGQSVTQLASRVMGRSMRTLGIHVEVGKTQAAVDVRIITHYGVSIVEVASKIRRNVRDRIEAMTGLECVEINIEVVDLYFEEEARPQPEALPARVQ